MDGPGTATSDFDSGFPGLWRQRARRTTCYATLAARQDGPFLSPPSQFPHRRQQAGISSIWQPSVCG